MVCQHRDFFHKNRQLVIRQSGNGKLNDAPGLLTGGRGQARSGDLADQEDMAPQDLPGLLTGEEPARSGDLADQNWSGDPADQNTGG